MKRFFFTGIAALLNCLIACSQNSGKQSSNSSITQFNNPDRIIPAAERINVYLPLIKGKKVGIFANHTSTVGNGHLVDTLQKLGVDIRVIFGPEHGFRGTIPDGVKIADYKDEKTGILVVSLYGAKRRPSTDDIKDVDVLIFDIQDVGTRFYTYISSMQEFLECAIENNKPLILLDRPNPNGFYVDGPVLDPKFKSFVGMQPIPINYGMTMAEYAKMLLYEKWIKKEAADKLIIDTLQPLPTRLDSIVISAGFFSQLYTDFSGSDSIYLKFRPRIRSDNFSLFVVTNANYTHKSKYVLPVKPSPNLPDMQSIYLYPSTCLFEGTALSEGRGTAKPFQYIGHPDLPKNLFSFTPNPNEGSKSSKHFGKVCYGWNLGGTLEEVIKKVDGRIQLKWLIEAYKLFTQKDSFFLRSNSFNRLSGTDVLMQQIKDGKSEEEIRKTWEPKLSEFKVVRKKYLLYEDFE
jgi:uncharacterized protein YbbC (DUF1343 family)